MSNFPSFPGHRQFSRQVPNAERKKHVTKVQLGGGGGRGESVRGPFKDRTTVTTTTTEAETSLAPSSEDDGGNSDDMNSSDAFYDRENVLVASVDHEFVGQGIERLSFDGELLNKLLKNA